MSVSKEVRIGILAIAALIIFFTGFYFLKGANLFSKNIEYNCYYTNIDGLQNSANVQVKGLNVGRVSRMKLSDDNRVLVTITIDKKIKIPEGTVATLASFDLLGGKIIRLDLGKGPGILEKGGTLPTALEGGVVDKVSGELTPRLQELRATIAGFNKAIDNVNGIINPQNQRAITEAIQSINASARSLAQLSAVLNKESGDIQGVIHNARSVSGNLAKNNDTINNILSNLNNVSRQLARAPIEKTMIELQHASTQMQGMMDKINNNKGSLGMLINDKEVYNNLNKSLNSLHSLTEDMKAHPSRYINVSVFGKKRN